MPARLAFTLLFAAMMLPGCGGTTEAPSTTNDADEQTSESTETTEVTPPTSETNRNSAFVITDEDTTEEQPAELTLGNPAPTNQEVDQSDAAEASEPTLEKADVGAGKKGRGYGGDPITEPAKQYFAIRERAVFQIQIPQALNMYKALNGKLPKDHEEFMSKVIKENNISLPELPEGKKYLFDADKGELMIQTGGDQTAAE